jgi:hypothetical protein
MVRYAAAFLILATLVVGAGSAFADPASPGPASGEAGLRGLDAPPVAASAAPASAPLAGSDPRPRLYSLHRDYGETPDRTVLPPEFFLTPAAPAASTDLAAPPPASARDRQGRVDPGDPDTPQT